jgi:hypothetical protein
LVVFTWTVESRYSFDVLRDSSADYQELADELSALCKLQSQALQASAYKMMSAQEAQEYDARRIRIGELSERLGKFKPPSR